MAKCPVVVYGASGYTGMLIMDWLIDQDIPFTAVARNAKRSQEMMAQRVVRLESATYEIIEAEHTVASLTQAFTGAKVVCATVGPFVKYGLVTVEAALKAGCHQIDTSGEQAYIRAVRDQFGELYRQAGLLVSPSLAYMYTYSEIAAELALETPGIDALETSSLCRGPRGGASGVTVGSTASIFEMYRSEPCYLWEKRLVPHAPHASFNVTSPDFMQPVFALPWSGTSLPVYFEHDPRVRSCVSCVGFYDTEVMKTVHAWASSGTPSTSTCQSNSRMRCSRTSSTRQRRACPRVNARRSCGRSIRPSGAASSPPCARVCMVSRPTSRPAPCRRRPSPSCSTAIPIASASRPDRRPSGTATCSASWRSAVWLARP